MGNTSTEKLLDLVWFHGEFEDKARKPFPIRKPSSLKPLWATYDFGEAKGYSYGSNYGDEDILYAFFLNPHSQTFDFRTDCLRLLGKTYFSDKTIRLLDKEYKSMDFNLWEKEHILMDMLEEIKILRISLGKIFGEDSEVFYRDEINHILNRTSANPFTDMFNHFHSDESKVKDETIEGCRSLLELVRQRGYSSITEAFERNINGKDITLISRMIAETMDAMAAGKFPLEVMSFRKVLMKAIAELGCSVVFDTNSNDASSGIVEVAILDLNGIDKILNEPIVKGRNPESEKMKRIVQFLIMNKHDKIPKDQFLKILANGH